MVIRLKNLTNIYLFVNNSQMGFLEDQLIFSCSFCLYFFQQHHVKLIQMNQII